MKKFAGCLAVSVGIPSACILAFYAVTFTVAGVVAEQLPEPFRSVAWDWIKGEPQKVGHPSESDIHPTYAGEVVEGGSYYWAPHFYSGITSFRCELPVARGYITSGYGDTEYRTKPHTGVDYGTYQAPADVYAPMGGRVTHAGWSYWMGWTVVVENNGWQTILGHMCCGSSGKSSSPTGLSSLQVSSGDIIDAGIFVGRTGDTGNSFGIHLHFEVRRCDEEGRCRIINPSDVMLPGQSSFCAWEALGDK